MEVNSTKMNKNAVGIGRKFLDKFSDAMKPATVTPTNVQAPVEQKQVNSNTNNNKARLGYKQANLQQISQGVPQNGLEQ